MLVAAAAVGGMIVALAGGGDDTTQLRPRQPGPAPAQAIPPPPAPQPPVAPPAAALKGPRGLAVAPDGSLLIADSAANQILKRAPDGRLEVVAGIGVAGYSGDGGPAIASQLSYPIGIAVAPDGTVVFADSGNDRVRAIAPDGIITTVAGNGGSQSVGDGGLAVLSELFDPSSLALGSDGTVYIVAGAVRVVSPDGIMTTLIQGGAGVLDVESERWAFFPSAIAIDGDGNLFVASFSPKLIAKFDAHGNLLAVIGRGEIYVSPGAGLASGPNGIVAALWSFSIGLVTDSGITRIAGDFRPNAVAVAPDGTVYASTIAGSGGREPTSVMRIDTDGNVSVLVS